MKQPQNVSSTNADALEVSYDIVKKLRNMKQFGEKDTKLVLSNIINRVRFMYRWQEIASYVFRCLCVRRIKEKKEHHFNKGKDKLL